MGSRNTLQDLQEFRRRKAAEREAALSTSKPEDKLKNPVITDVGERKESEEFCEELCSVRVPSFWERFSSWIYQLVMPETIIRDGPEDFDEGTVNEDSEASCAVEENFNSSLWSNRLLRKLPWWMQRIHLWWLLAWACGFALAIRFGWGAVYFSLSVLVIIWIGLNDSRKRRRGTPSAYSVFNPNCEKIEGTLDAEQLQRQMFFRF